MTGIVLDNSIAASWAFRDEAGGIPPAMFMHRVIVVPGLWWFELRNTLIVGERRGRILPGESRAFLATMLGLRLQWDDERESDAVMETARTYGLSLYDAVYLELALRRRLPLATLDRQLAAAANAAHVEVLGASL